MGRPQTSQDLQKQRGPVNYPLLGLLQQNPATNWPTSAGRKAASKLSSLWADTHCCLVTPGQHLQVWVQHSLLHCLLCAPAPAMGEALQQSYPLLPPARLSQNCSQAAETFPRGHYTMQILLTYCFSRTVFTPKHLCNAGLQGRQPGAASCSCSAASLWDDAGCCSPLCCHRADLHVALRALCATLMQLPKGKDVTCKPWP